MVKENRKGRGRRKERRVMMEKRRKEIHMLGKISGRIGFVGV